MTLLNSKHFSTHVCSISIRLTNNPEQSSILKTERFDTIQNTKHKSKN